jgi:hypothetical protein
VADLQQRQIISVSSTVPMPQGTTTNASDAMTK